MKPRFFPSFPWTPNEGLSEAGALGKQDGRAEVKKQPLSSVGMSLTPFTAPEFLCKNSI